MIIYPNVPLIAPSPGYYLERNFDGVLFLSPVILGKFTIDDVLIELTPSDYTEKKL